MGLVAVAETAELISAKQVKLSETDKEFVVQFAFSTGDMELTNKLIDELMEDGVDKGAVLQKYSTMTGFQPDWIKRIENLLVALEMYRIQEEKAIYTLSELLVVCGISLSEEKLRSMGTEAVQQMVKKEVRL